VVLHVLRAAAVGFAILSGLSGLARPGHAAEVRVRPAADGIFAAFKKYPLVGLGDAHGLAEEGEFYGQLIRDPRFAAEVGNVVFEVASSSHQATLDRYLNGEDVPRAELRKVWSDAIGWVTPPSVMYQEFLAAVRAANLKLPPQRRIKVWAGGPPAGWGAIKTRDDFSLILDQRDVFAAELIERQILARGKKALVIYGGLHFVPLPSPPFPADAGLKKQVERKRPGAFYVVWPYFGFWRSDCSAGFEAQTRWPPGSLVTPVKGTFVEALMQRPGCTVFPPPAASPPLPEAAARVQAAFARLHSGAEADALLYLAPAAGLTLSPDDPDLTTDPAYAAEIRRRLPITGGPPDFMNRLVRERRPYRQPAAGPAAAAPAQPPS
jgi:hypothetical protein